MSEPDSIAEGGISEPQATEYRSSIDPGQIDQAGTIAPEQPARRRRGRQPGYSPKAAAEAKAKAQVDLSGLTAMFVGLHVALATWTKTPELEITGDEGQNFMTRGADVMRHYSVQRTQKTIDWLAFYGAIATLYVPRYIAIRNRKRADRATFVGPLPSVVTPGQSETEPNVIRPDFTNPAAE